MKTIDLCVPHPYSPLIPAVKAICEADEGEQLEIILGDATALDLRRRADAPAVREEGVELRPAST